MSQSYFTFFQVYIVAMKQQDSPSPVNAGDEEDFSEPSGSLLELVEPELKSLSKYWLGALRDHALLALPTEYSSQLPPQGGMFYRYVMSSPQLPSKTLLLRQ